MRDAVVDYPSATFGATMVSLFGSRNDSVCKSEHPERVPQDTIAKI